MGTGEAWNESRRNGIYAVDDKDSVPMPLVQVFLLRIFVAPFMP